MEIVKKGNIIIEDLEFRKYLSEEKIKHRIIRLAQKIDADFIGKKPLFITVLNGSFIFCSDLVRALNMDVEIEFLKVKSYEGLESSGEIKESINTLPNIEGRDLIIVEDIVDKGNTINHLHQALSKLNPASITVVSLLYKPAAYLFDINIDYVGFEIPNDFVVGYGLDYNGYGRSYRDLYVLDNENMH